MVTRKTLKRWTQADLDEIRATVKADLDSVSSELLQRHEHALTRISQLENCDEGDDLIKRFCYTVSTLLCFAQDATLLSKTQVNRLSELAEGILKTCGISPGPTIVGALWGDLYAVRGLVHRASGRHLLALWEHDQAIPCYGGMGELHASQQTIMLADRAVRIGSVAWGIELFAEVEKAALSESKRNHVRSARLHCLRVANRFDECLSLVEATLGDDKFSDPVRNTALWVNVWVGGVVADDYRQLFKSVDRQGPHHHPFYILQAFLLAKSLSDPEAWPMAKIATLRRNSELGLQVYPLFLDFALMIESCSDKEIPRHLRISNLGTALDYASQHVSADHAPLFWAAAYRWLQVTKRRDLARACQDEYAAASSRVTNGLTLDCLNIGGSSLDASAKKTA